MEYFSNDLMPGRVFFRCERMRATLTTDACSAMWRRENNGCDGEHEGCHCCPIGASHAGEVAASMSPLKGAKICGRCHRPASRLIHRHLCISCQNRAYECARGRNAKGTAPVKAPRVDVRRLHYLAGSDPQTLRMASIDTDELIVAVLRDSRQRVSIAFNASPPPAVLQARLW